MLRVMNRNSGARMELFCYMFAIWIQIVWTVRTKRIARQTSAHLVIFVAKVDSASRIRGSLMRNQIVPTVMTKGLKNANNILNVNFTNSRVRILCVFTSFLKCNGVDDCGDNSDEYLWHRYSVARLKFSLR